MKKVWPSRFINFMTVFAFCVNIMMPFFMAYTAGSVAQARQSGIAGQFDAGLWGKKIPICTPAGIKWVDIVDISDPELQTTDGPLQHPHFSYECALCYTALKKLTDGIPPSFGDGIHFVYDGFYTKKFHPFDEATFTFGYIRQLRFSRAPPAFLDFRT